MLYSNRNQKPHSPVYVGVQVGHHLIHKRFQLKYMIYLIVSVGIGSLIFLGPAFYFLNQNYLIFTDLAFKNNPSLIQHLEQESLWLKAFLSVSFVGIVLMILVISLKMTKSLIGPLIAMEKHMRTLISGAWGEAADSLFDNSNEDYKELSMTYEYLFQELKASVENDLAMLSRLSIDPQNREAYLTWQKLIHSKQSQLGYIQQPQQISDFAEKPASTPSLRPAA